ncbi:MAG: hypothetical protein IPL35_00240 [Sphingobacteriales bacterium]|nr:hypothetical protein [Sphingobacteriales bacterium]
MKPSFLQGYGCRNFGIQSVYLALAANTCFNAAPAPTTNEVAAIKAAGTNYNKVHLSKKATITPGK